ncbi:tRNA lysidine(34) synthetase TilS [Streptococcus ovuberis]|uniref:tRNA(Ile)-lysidine synthase n=1 Tax=Streptococcus ovuberis TaxID=1936207 RepID=A0A7X6S1K5_9STRE|nr:tRNA lysidine(34) synthetase TilS [Streptococcus ovuberis]NKZ21363.1 tRNA lysidine(34) synthetase TilS [Streptococcus ovuberis]
MKEKFLKVANHRHFFDKHSNVLLAVSGGADSMALLELLKNCQKSLGIKIGIAHVHHGQRPESDQEAAYLENYARDRDIAFHMTYFKGQFSEKKARDFRYDFFKQIMRDFNYTALVTAHHKNDQAETVFMRLLRGSKWFHLSAIKERQDFGPGELIRPLLTFTKKELPSVFHFEDASNRENNYLRNRIRNRYLPQLSQENPRLSDSLVSLSQDMSHLQEALLYLTKSMDIQDLENFKASPKGLQIFLLEHYLTNFPELALSRGQLDEMLYSLENKVNTIYKIRKDYQLVITYERFYIEKINPETYGDLSEVVLESGNTLNFGQFTLSFNIPLMEWDQEILLSSGNPIVLRHQQIGDQMIYKGHSRKLKRIYQDQRISILEKEKAVILEQDKKIIGIAGIAASDLSKSLKNDTIENKLYIKKMRESIC